MSTTLALIPAPASANGIPPAGSVKIELVAMSGTGCPLGTVTVNSTEEHFRVYYGSYTAYAGGNQPPSDSRRSCQLTVRVTHPPEFTYGIMRVENQGFSSLEEGASGTLRSSFTIFGKNPPAGRKHVMRGPYSDVWQLIDQSDIPEVPVKPCGERSNTTLATELQVDAGTSDPSKTSLMSLDSTDSSIGTSYLYYWQRC
ncbi:DUF4360 domain-containing protein [Actinomadura litoris]|uniref:DUF4360 domain-containing protein n=1 Tax=Actinomadura litoris TaxID=2678616 RepID=UPI001FA6ADE9|nr:DUF4360 domain-containing protein [Actinomadura litoris]